MYKFTSYLSSNRLVLIRRHVGNGSCSALVMMRQPDRHYATHQTDEHCKASVPTKKSSKFFWGVVGATVLTGVAVTYAKQSPDARNFLQSNVPWASDFVALVFQENTTYWKFTVGKFNKYSTMLSHFLFGKEGVTPLDITSKSQQDLEALAEKAYAPQTYALPPIKFKPLYVEEITIGTPEVEGPATLIQTEKCKPVKPPVIKITEDMVALEHNMHTYTKTAIDNYKEATKHAETYNKALFRIVEAGYDDLDKKFFTNLSSAQDARNKAIKKAKDAFGKAGCAIETLNRMIQSGVQAPPEEVTATLRYIKNFRADLSAAEQAYRAEVDKGVLANKYWTKVEAARRYYRDELRAMFPGIDLNAHKMDLRGDTDLLLLYTLRQVQYLQNEIAEIQTIREAKIARAIECHDEKLIIEAKVEDMVKRDKMAQERQYQKKALEIQAEANRNLKEQMKKALEMQQEIQADLLRKKEAEVMNKFARLVNEALENDRVKFKKELAAMAGKLLAIEQTLKQRAKAEAEARRSQSLWAAAEALLAATRRQVQETKIDSELQAVEKAGKDDKLVDTVLKGIPKEVRDNGIATEKALRDRFEQLETTANKVALVGREGAALPVYFLSWLQSKLMWSSFNEIPHKELENQPTDFTKLDTFDIIQRAKYYMQRGDLPSALKYVNLLQGGPRAAALPWLNAARHHLEIKQAAETVMAHASVSGLLYL